MKRVLQFTMHILIAMVLSMVLGSVLSVMFGPIGPSRTPSRNPWLDVPYSPLFWGSAFALGLLTPRYKSYRGATWVWVIGLIWLILFAISSTAAYDPRWCDGCSRSQYLWYGYFSYWKCSDECMGQLFVTTPMLSSIAYSIGAKVASLIIGMGGKPELHAPEQMH